MQGMTVEQKCSCFFNVDATFEVPRQEDFWTVYACCLIEYNKLSTRQEGIPANKRRNTSVCIEGICEAKIKITYIIATRTVRVEHFKNTPHHSHPIEDSDLLNTLEVIRQLVAQEASKSYLPSSIVMTVKELVQKNDISTLAQNLTQKDVANI
ncbi:15206_t:CDS:2 [Cetraspora pellucida]|uniref:15206_t:CDS:1 n=1 Tax=Cetraspora pellucida TaxID=1433469 RepID=A0A9N8ZVA0_9GLOM|nr:15206_t:CDS:2 [Cetraspora pellucida]